MKSKSTHSRSSGAAQGRGTQLSDLLSPAYQDAARLETLKHEFLRRDYVKLPNLLTDAAFAVLRAEAQRVEISARQRSFLMEGYETPRELKTLGGSRISEESPILASIYSNEILKATLQTIAGAAIHPCLHADEFIVLNYLTHSGETHGWHLDDPAYALIVLLEAPAPEAGGLLELIKDWGSICERAGEAPRNHVDHVVELCRAARRVEVKHHAAGDAYLLRADRVLHRVTELTREGARRVVINLAFEATPNPTYGSTATKLYG